MKLHICCGDVYLKGYSNWDIKGEIIKPGESNPNETTLDRYYIRDFKETLGNKGSFIVDYTMNILGPWLLEDNSVDEIVMISAIEHFTKPQAKFITSEVYRVLKPGGKFLVDFPDLKRDILNYYDSDPDFMAKLIYCNQKDDLSQHKWGYTPESFMDFLGEDYWDFHQKDVVKHDYPMIGFECTKRDK
jgi:SAM-dependent methyltransferase